MLESPGLLMPVLVWIGLTWVLPVTAEGWRGALAIRDGRVLLAENADRLLAPASVTKIVVAAAALERLGPEYRARTELASAAPLDDGVLAGDLVLRPAGDPTWSERFFPDDPRAPLRALARGLATRGVRRVTGALVVDLGRFPGLAQPRSRPLAELAMGWAAPTAALALDDNAFVVHIAPGAAVGAPASARHEGGGAGLPPLENEMRTVGRERHEKGTVEIWPLPDRDAILLRGEYPISEPPYRMLVAWPAPERRAAEALLAALADAGITVDGGVRLSPVPVRPAGRPLAHHDSPPLARWLEPILEESSNWHAEMLLRQLTLAAGGDARLDDALDLVGDFLANDVGVARGHFFFDDGSGLSADNLLTPRAAVELLAWVWRRPWRKIFVDALAAPGEGTLAGWGKLPPVAAKTGTRRHTQTLAGYLRPAAPEPVIFAVFLDHRLDAGPARRDEIAALLRRLDAGGAKTSKPGE